MDQREARPYIQSGRNIESPRPQRVKDYCGKYRFSPIENAYLNGIAPLDSRNGYRKYVFQPIIKENDDSKIRIF